MDKPAEVEEVAGLPVRVGEQRITHILDSYRVWPSWWEGQPPRDYYLVQIQEKTVEIYRTLEGWFYSKTLD